MDAQVDRQLRLLRGRVGTYTTLTLPVVALLLLGLMLPFLLGTPMSSNTGGHIASLGTLKSAGTSGGTAAGGVVGGAPLPSGASSAATAPSDAGSPGAVTAGGSISGATTPANGGALKATDVGVTSNGIRVAVLVPKLGGFSQTGYAVDLGDSKAAFGAFFDELNRSGGILGRRISASYINFDPLNDSSMRSACLQATEDDKVFTSFNVNGFYGPGILCMSEEHKTPFVQAYYSDPDEWYQRSNNLYVTAYPSKSRTLRDLVYELDARGALKGKKIGIVDSDYPFDKSASESALIPTLRKLGYTVAHRSTLSSDTATAQSQVPLEVQRMQAAGVDTIFFACYFVYVTTWVQQASNSQYYPQYLQSDYANGATDDATSNLPASYDGAIAVTSTRVGEWRVGRAYDPQAAACLARYKRLTGQTLTPHSGAESVMLGACGSVDEFAAAARKAGADLTRLRLRNGFEALGQVQFPLMAPLTWGPGKTDGGDEVRLVQWHENFQGQQCKCWIPVDDFHAARG
jgi:ABC-type branched-subunit amino acid transport system substrate-binding protein